MVEIRLVRLVGVFVLCLIFIEIYQHNQIIKLSYEKQRLEIKKNDLKKTHSGLIVELCNFKSIDQVKKMVQEQHGMEKLKFSQVLTFTGF